MNLGPISKIARPGAAARLARHCLVWCFICLAHSLWAQANSREEVVAAYLYNFAKEIPWPDEAQRVKFNILIIGDNTDAIQLAMRGLVASRTIHNKPIALRTSSEISYWNEAQLIYLQEDREHLLPQLFEKVVGKPILVVTYNGLDKRLVMLNLYDTPDKRVMFELNRANIINQQLQVTDELVLLGGTELDVAQLYREGQKAQRRLLRQGDSLERKLGILQTALAESKETLRNQSDSIVFQANRIKMQQAEWALQMEKIGRQKELIKSQLAELAAQQAGLAKLAGKVGEQEAKLAEGQREIIEQEITINAQRGELATQSDLLEQRNQIIRKQHQITLLLVVVFLLAAILAMMVYRWYRQEGKLNKLLEQRVAQRTAALLESNKLLEKELKDKEALEKELIHTNEHFANVLGSMTDAFITLDSEYRITFMNAEAVRINNKPAEDCLGKTHWEEWPGSVGTPVEAAYRKAMTMRVAVHLEHHYEYDALYDVWLEIHAYPTKEGLGIYYHDITTRKQAEEKLKHSQAALAEAQSIARMGSWELAIDTGQTTWSEQMYQLMGLDAAEPVPPMEWFLAKVNETDRPQLERNMEAALLSGHSFSQVFRLWVAGDQWAWVEARVRPEPGPKGQVVALAGILIDITELQEAAVQLTRHLRELDTLNTVGRRVSASLSLNEVAMWALEAIVEEVKPDAAFLFLRQDDRLVLHGFAPEEARHSFGNMPEHLVGKCLCGMAVREGRAIYSIDIHRDSRCTWQECKDAQMQSFAALPLRRGQEFFGVIGLSSTAERNFERQARFLETLASQVATGISNAMLHDSVLQNQAELEQRVVERTRQLAQARDRAEAADRVKSAFLATMSHELRTPLNSIIGFTGIMLQGHPGPLNPEQKKQLGMVQHSARHLLDLINDVLDISKIEAGELELYFSNINLLELLQDVLGLVAPLARSKGLELDFESNEAYLEINTDVRRLKQVILNIVNNAVKFTQEGGVRVGCQHINGRVAISVSDTGIGIEPQKVEGIFKPFSQIDNGLTRVHEGTGLGLSISLKLTRMLGGDIAVESAPGLGSTFTIHLPLSAIIEA